MLKTKAVMVPKIIPFTPLTSQDVQEHNPKQMEQITKPRKKQPVGYPLRFRSKAQKERLEKAAKSVRKTLKDFLIDLGEQAAAEMGRQSIAS